MKLKIDNIKPGDLINICCFAVSQKKKTPGCPCFCRHKETSWYFQLLPTLVYKNLILYQEKDIIKIPTRPILLVDYDKGFDFKYLYFIYSGRLCVVSLNNIELIYNNWEMTIQKTLKES